MQPPDRIESDDDGFAYFRWQTLRSLDEGVQSCNGPFCGWCAHEWWELQEKARKRESSND